MHRTEHDELTDCMECGATVAPGPDRAFAITDAAVLCHACATQRGGQYDELDDRWLVPPGIGDLPTSAAPIRERRADRA